MTFGFVEIRSSDLFVSWQAIAKGWIPIVRLLACTSMQGPVLSAAGRSRSSSGAEPV